MSTESRAVYITAVGKVEIQDAPKLAIPAGYLLVKTKAVALNPTDWKSVDYSNSESIGSRLGVDYAGVVEDFAPDVKGWSKGDRVCGMVWGGKDANNGAFGDYIIAIADLQLKVPDNLSFEAAATVGVAITTVGQALYQLLELPLPPAAPSSPPQTLLVGGGSTATAVVGIQYAKLSGLKVIATASPYNFDYLRSLGVDVLLDYHEDADTLVRKIREITGDDLTLAWDTSPNDHYPSIAARALSSTKKSVFATVNPLIPEGFLKDVNPLVDAKFQLGYSIFGEAIERGGRHFPASPEDVEFGKKFWHRSGKLFGEGKIQTTRFELNRGGQSWEGVLHGLQELRTGNVKGTKLVYNV